MRKIKKHVIKTGVFVMMTLLSVAGLYVYERQFEVVEIDAVEDSFVVAAEKSGLILNLKEGFGTEDVSELTYAVDGEEYELKMSNDIGFFYDDRFADLDLILNFGRVKLDPKTAIFDLAVQDDRMEMVVLYGDVGVQFFDGTQKLNEFLVAQGRKVVIPYKKVDSDLAVLLRSKLQKEFRYSLVPQRLYEEDWVQENLAEGKLIGEKMKEEIRAGYRSVSFKNGGFVENLRGTFTVLPNKKEQRYFASLFGNLDNALKAAAVDDDDKVDSSLQRFVELLDESYEGDYYDEVTDKMLMELRVFGPNDLENEVFMFLLEKKFAAGDFEEKQELLAMVWSNVYEAIVLGDDKLLAKVLLNDYSKYYGALVNSADVEDDLLSFVENQNAAVYSLMIQYPYLYKDSFFEMKLIMEEDLLGLVERDDLRLELKQSLISEKIDLLKRLRYFFFENEVEILEAKEIYKRLMNEVKALMPDANVGGAAVIELFEEQLSDVEDFWGYLTSPSYHSVGAGHNHKDRYAAYLEDRKKIDNVSSLRQEVFGEVLEREVTVFEVQAEIEAVFDKFEDIGDLAIGEIDDVEARNVKVSAVVGGYPFEAIYDRYTQNVEEVYVYEELVSDRAVKLDNLLPLLQERFADLAEVVDDSLEEIGAESVAQRSARLFLSEKMEDIGFVVGIDKVSVFDEKNALYRVEKVHVSSDEEVEVLITFDIDMTKEQALNVFMNVKGELKVLEGSYEFEDLVSLVESELRFLNEPVVVEEVVAEEVVAEESGVVRR